MTRLELRLLLDQVRDGTLDPDEAESRLLVLFTRASFEDLGFARVDHNRAVRKGFPEVVFGLGRIGFSEYGTPTTRQVPEAVSREIADCDAVLLANHGALTVGDSVMQAYYRMETLEMYARIRLVTIQLGGPAALSEPEIEELYRVGIDPLEAHNLADDADHSAIKDQLGKRCDYYLHSLGR